VRHSHALLPLQAPTALLCSIYRFGCESVPRPSRGSCWYIPCTSAPGLLTTGLQLTVVVHQVCAERGTSDYLVYQRLIDKQVPSQDCRSLSFSEHPSPDLHVLPICLSSHFGVRGTLAPRSRFRTVGSPRTVNLLEGALGANRKTLFSFQAKHIILKVEAGISRSQHLRSIKLPWLGPVIHRHGGA
jgi:hypothetical protein